MSNYLDKYKDQQYDVRSHLGFVEDCKLWGCIMRPKLNYQAASQIYVYWKGESEKAGGAGSEHVAGMDTLRSGGFTSNASIFQFWKHVKDLSGILEKAGKSPSAFSLTWKDIPLIVATEDGDESGGEKGAAQDSKAKNWFAKIGFRPSWAAGLVALGGLGGGGYWLWRRKRR